MGAAPPTPPAATALRSSGETRSLPSSSQGDPTPSEEAAGRAEVGSSTGSGLRSQPDPKHSACQGNHSSLRPTDGPMHKQHRKNQARGVQDSHLLCVATDAPHCPFLCSRERPPPPHQRLAAAARLCLHSHHACRAF